MRVLRYIHQAFGCAEIHGVYRASAIDEAFCGLAIDGGVGGEESVIVREACLGLRT